MMFQNREFGFKAMDLIYTDFYNAYPAQDLTMLTGKTFDPAAGAIIYNSMSGAGSLTFNWNV